MTAPRESVETTTAPTSFLFYWDLLSQLSAKALNAVMSQRAEKPDLEKWTQPQEPYWFESFKEEVEGPTKEQGSAGSSKQSWVLIGQLSQGEKHKV